MKFQTEHVTINSLDGYPLPATIDTPIGLAIKGCFLLLHGCPSYKDEYGFYGYETRDKIGMSEYFASKGYMCLRFNYRSQDINMSPIDMHDLQINGMVNDTEAAFLYLKQRAKGNINIYVVATSFAGSIALLWEQSFQHNINHLFLMCPLLEIRDTLRSRDITYIDPNGCERISDDVVIELNNKGYIISGERKMTRAFINEVLAANTQKILLSIKHPRPFFMVQWIHL